MSMLSYFFLSNREISLLILITIILIYVISHKDTRKSLMHVFKAFFALKVINLFLVLVLFTEVVTIILYTIGIWTLYSLKETVIWLVFVPIPLLVNSIDDSFSFKKIVIQQISLTSIISFIIDQYTFSLIWELLITFLIATASILYAYSSYENEFKINLKWLSSLLTTLGTVIVINSLYGLIIHRIYLNPVMLAREYAVFPIYTIFSLPIIYLIVVYSKYEILFLRCSFMVIDNPILLKQIQISILKQCRFKLEKIKLVSSQISFEYVKSIEKFQSWINNM